MTRYLPIAMLALGLVLLSTSFASARTMEQPAPTLVQVCVLDMAETTLDTPPDSLGRCWKVFGMNMAIPGCSVYAQLPANCAIEPPQPDSGWDAALPLLASDGLSPPLALPPPKA